MPPSPSPKRAESSMDSGSISMHDYGSVNQEQQQLLKSSTSPKRSPTNQRSPNAQHRSSLTSLTSSSATKITLHSGLF